MNTIGRPNPNDPPQIEMNGIGIVQGHAKMEYDQASKTATIYPNADDPEKNKVYVNGKLITGPMQLNHDDRVLFGSGSSYFVYVDP